MTAARKTPAKAPARAKASPPKPVSGLLEFRRRAVKEGPCTHRNEPCLHPDPAQCGLHADLPGAPAGSWPLAGVELTAAPDVTSISTAKVVQGLREGWIVGSGRKVVHRPAGTPEAPYTSTGPNQPGTLTFYHYSELVICGVEYRVTRQADKFLPDGVTPVDEENFYGPDRVVEHFYNLERKG